MGYDTSHLSIPLRLDSHGGSEQREDKQAALDLKARIEEVIRDDARFARIARIGVDGP
jgi:hypothetical protein